MTPVLRSLIALVVAVPLSHVQSAAAQEVTTPDAVTQAFATQWARASSTELEPLFDPRGVLFAVEGREHRDLDAPRLMASVDELRDGTVGGGVRVLRVVSIQGSPNQAFAELSWEPVMAGTSEAMHRTLYLGLRHHDGRWWVSEIRVLSS